MTTKLDRDNYSLWVAQLVPILIGSDLMGFIDGSNPCPPEFVLDAVGRPTKEKNPDFRNWIKQDQNILGILNNTLSSSVLLSVCQHKTSRDVWVALEKRYASQSRNRVLELRRKLLRTTRDESSISDFLDRINNVAHRLALAGKPVDEDDLITIIMQNVGPAYEVTVSSAQARDTPITYDVLVSLLLSAESRLKTHMVASLDHHVTTALFAPKQHRNGGHGGYKKDGRSFGYKPNTLSGNKSGSILGQPKPTFNTNSGSGQAPSTPSHRPKCQICKRLGHEVVDCYNRFNVAYEGRVPPQRLQAMAASTTWFSDSGASNHITSDLSNLSISKEYTGNENVTVGNGAGFTHGEDAFPRDE